MTTQRTAAHPADSAECVDCGRKHSPSKHAAHPADSAEALLRWGTEDRFGNVDPPRRAAAEGSEPLDVERLARAVCAAGFGPRDHQGRIAPFDELRVEWQEAARSKAQRIAAAYASQPSEGTE